MEVVDNERDLGKQMYCIRCRLCRKQLLISDKIKFSHSGSTEPCGNCLFLDEECLPEWIQTEVDNSLWTKGRLKCARPECTARVGGFDFVQGLLCACGEFTIPAIWIQDGKVDVRVTNSDDAMSKSQPSLMSGYQSRLRQMPASDASQGNSFDQAIGETPINGRKETTLVQSGGFDNTNTCISEILSKPSQRSLHQAIGGETSETGFVQITRQNNVNIGMADVEGLSTLAHTSTVSKILHTKGNLNHEIEISLMEQNKDKTIIKPMEIDFELGNKTSNRFNALSVEEAGIVKFSSNNTAHIARQDHLICAVCLDYFYKPYQCPCTHIFCESCLRQLYHNRAGSLKCPICRSPVKYIEQANEIREEIRNLHNPVVKQREAFEKTTKYRKWPLPPIGPLPFLRKRQTLVPSQDQNLVKLAGVLLLVVCYVMLYILP